MEQPGTEGHRPGRARVVAALLAVLAVLAVLLIAAVTVGPGLLDPDGKPSEPPSASASASPTPTVDPKLPTADDLLAAGELRALANSRWTATRTDSNTSGSGVASVCQQSRFADPDGLAALVRAFRAAGTPSRSAVQSVEVSRSARQAAAAYRTVERWYAGCRASRLQLLDAYRVDGVGDRATVLTLRIWRKPVTTLSVALARTRAVTTATVGTTVGGTVPGPRAMTVLLARSVRRLCARSGAPACVREPAYRAVPPPVAGGERGVLAIADLPPVGRVDRPWVATRPVRFRPDRATTTCDRSEYFRSGATRARTRTYLITGASLPARFGLSTTYATFPTDKAAVAFLSGVRSSVAGCEDRDLATQVSAERRPLRRSSRAEASAWDLTMEVSPTRDVRFRLGFVRTGRFVAQLTFVPSDTEDMSQAGFDALLVRAGDRLGELTAAGR